MPKIPFKLCFLLPQYKIFPRQGKPFTTPKLIADEKEEHAENHVENKEEKKPLGIGNVAVSFGKLGAVCLQICWMVTGP